jgi:hypothetical protein
VKDSSGALVPEAIVTLTNRETNQTTQVTASGEGFYRFSSLPPGNTRSRLKRPASKPAQ